ncbi:MAG: hypothetical protein LBQ57_06120 [Spirochaetales bacterium]|jgi:hypothetical protein|nr:hypothetical protein [Spirochaetales bacterium]
MKKRMLVCVLLAAALFTVSAAPAGKPKITLKNSTGYEVEEIYISPASSEEWGDDYLVNATLDDGESFTVTLSSPLSEVDTYDIQFIDFEGDSYTQFDVPVKNGAVIEMTMDDLDDYDEEYAEEDTAE